MPYQRRTCSTDDLGHSPSARSDTFIFKGKLLSLTGHFVAGISRIDMTAPERISDNDCQAALIWYLLLKDRSLEERGERDKIKTMRSNDKIFSPNS